MPDPLTIDFGALKRALAGSEPVNCAVIMLPDRTASLKVNRRKSAKAIRKELIAESEAAGFRNAKCFFGTASMDEYPGLLRLTLNRAPPPLNLMLRTALRGSGFNKIDITLAADSDETEGESQSESF